MRPAHRRAQIVRDHALGDPAEKPQRARGCSSTPRAPRRTPAPRAAPRSPGPRWAPCARRRRRTASRRRARRACRRVAMQIDRSVVSEDPVHRHQPDCYEAEERGHVVSVAESGPVDDRPCRGPVVLDGVDPVRVYAFRPAPAVLERGAGRQALGCRVEVAPLLNGGSVAMRCTEREFMLRIRSRLSPWNRVRLRQFVVVLELIPCLLFWSEKGRLKAPPCAPIGLPQVHRPVVHPHLLTRCDPVELVPVHLLHLDLLPRLLLQPFRECLLHALHGPCVP